MKFFFDIFDAKMEDLEDTFKSDFQEIYVSSPRRGSLHLNVQVRVKSDADFLNRLSVIFAGPRHRYLIELD